MAVLGFGAVTLGREIGEDASLAILDHSFELGFRIFDTAEAYGGGNSHAYRIQTFGEDDVREASVMMHSSEILLGRWMQSRGVRRQVEVHTKISSDHSPEGINIALTRSLDRLQTDYADGYYLHSAPTDPFESMSALAEQRKAGRARRIGICNASVGTMAAAHRIAPLDLCQNIYNLAQPDADRELIPWCRAHKVDFVAYSPLGAGFLTGKYGPRGELAPKGTRFDVVPGHRDVYFRPECFSALDRLTAVSAQSGVPQHLLALSWVLRQPDVSIVLIGATRLQHLDNAIAAVSTPVDAHLLDSLDPDLSIGRP
jgi:aryl-alcohol dehydrogenase-like predicted oxidoreductase